MRLLGWVYLALFCALCTAGLYLGVLYSGVAPSWVMILLAGVAVAAVLAGAKMAAWSHRRTASHERTAPPWWWFLLLTGVIMSGPLLGRLVSTFPVLTVLFMLGAAMGTRLGLVPGRPRLAETAKANGIVSPQEPRPVSQRAADSSA